MSGAHTNCSATIATIATRFRRARSDRSTRNDRRARLAQCVSGMRQTLKSKRWSANLHGSSNSCKLLPQKL